MTDVDTRGLLFILCNVTIFAGYVFLAAVVVPRATARLWRTRVGGIGFFFTCGLTHLEQALHYLYGNNEVFSRMAVEWHMMAIHLVQAVCVWMFVTGLYLEMVRWGPWAAGHDDDQQ